MTEVALELKKMTVEAERCATDRLSEWLGITATSHELEAASFSLYLVKEDGFLQRVVGANMPGTLQEIAACDEQGIVPFVARTGKAYLCRDTQADKHYIASNDKTRSEAAFPIVFGSKLIGVANLEWSRVGGFPQDIENLMRARLARLVPHLLVLRGLDPGSSQRLSWNPEIHGWDLGVLMQRICRVIVCATDPERAKCSFWYADRIKEDLSVYATYGYAWQYRGEKSLRMKGSWLGEYVGSNSNEIRSFDPRTSQVHSASKVARAMNLDHAVAQNVFAPGGDSAIGALVAFFHEAGEDPEAVDARKVASDALPEIAGLVGRLMEAHVPQRLDIAEATVMAEIGQFRGDASRGKLEQLIALVCRILDCDAASLYGVEDGLMSGRDWRKGTLRCFASTGFRKVDRTTNDLSGIDERDCHVEEQTIPLSQPQGHTIATYFAAGRSVRRNRLCDDKENGLPPKCPERGVRSTQEYIPGERFDCGDHSKRRFLGCAVMNDLEPIGVLRAARLEGSRPFTSYDELLVARLCRAIRPLLLERIEEWSQTHRSVPTSR